ncbi:MAG: replication-associated recombination protein A [Verrucomicrobia bacterium]|nr:replication-associated recombination protein A [Verrucomicrobiota bacterium]
MDLFGDERADNPVSDNASPGREVPLAARMRPRTLDEYVGQEHLIGPGKLLRRAIEADRVGSVILYGPPGSGKTALAHVIASVTESRFVELSAVITNVAELKQIAADAGNRLRQTGRRTTLFLDEIHRFNKAQQDVLLPFVERGILTLIGATTYNPFFYINAALVSRSKILPLKPLDTEAVRTIVKRTLGDPERGLGAYRIKLLDEALEHILAVSEGDARKALNALEIASLSTPPGADGVVVVDRQAIEESIQRKAIVYDRDGDQHYDTASAFIKSMRGSDPDAALYWLAKMLEAGEDPRFIARRIVIAAAEDVGNADPRALSVATAAFQAVDFVGMPEAQIPLAQAVVYLATAPKSNASYMGISKAREAVQQEQVREVPIHLRDASYAGAKRLGHGEGYKYAHGFEGHIVEQEYVSGGERFYVPSDQGYERTIAERLEYWRAQLASRRGDDPPGGG